MIRSMIIDKTPDQLKLDFVLWTRKAVGELVLAKLGINLPVRTIGDYLKRWGMTPQKPAKNGTWVSAFSKQYFEYLYARWFNANFTWY